MASMYFVWKDPNCNGVNPEWIQMTSKRFKDFVSEPENAKRKFIRIPIDPEVKSKGCYVLETTPDGYRKWDADRRREYRSADVLDFPRRRYKDKELPSYCDETSYKESQDDDPPVRDAEVGNRRRKNKPEIMCLVSMEDCADPEEELTLHDVIADPSFDIEAQILKKSVIEHMLKVVDELPDVERQLIVATFFDNLEQKGGRDIATQLGLSKSDYYRKKEAILKKIREKLGQS